MDLSSSWFYKLAMNILSYCIVLVPIAIVVVTTKLKLCPTFFHSSSLVQWFVFGRDTRRYHALKTPDHNKELHEKLLLNDDLKRHSRPQDRPVIVKPVMSIVQFTSCFLGLQVSYLIWGILQEKIMTTHYVINDGIPDTAANGAHNFRYQGHFNHSLDLKRSYQETTPVITFHDSQFLVFVNRIVTFVVAIVALIIHHRPKNSQPFHMRVSCQDSSKDSKSSPPIYEYVFCSVSNILSSWCQYEALKYVNFPTQLLAKSCKIVPVMFMSRLILRKKYQTFDYMCALGFSFGMAFFLVFQPNNPDSRNQNVNNTSDSQTSDALSQHASKLQHSFLLDGLLILSLYLTFDSFTANWQQSLFSRYKTSEWQMMAAINFYSILLTLTSLSHLGSLAPALRLLGKSQQLLIDCLLMSFTSAFGQLFVYYTIKNFGPVIFTMIMISRQMISIILSYILFGHQITPGSAIGLVCVFAIACAQAWRRIGSKADLK